jgi:hypothetical protein
MPTFDPTTIDKVSSFANTDAETYRINEINLNNVANAAGSGAGASVTVAIVFSPVLPTSDYNIQVTPDQDAVAFVDSATKTTAGFTLTLNPRLAANTLGAGTSDIKVTWES